MQKTIKPNPLQRAFHRFLMLKPVTFVLVRILHRVDGIIFKLSGGKSSVTSMLAGLPIFQVTAMGAKSKVPRVIPLLGIPDGEKIALIASNFGQAHNPAWYYNLKANPHCQVQIDGVNQPYIAREAEGQEYEHFWNLAVSYYAGYAAYKVRAAHRHIPVLILEPSK